MTARALLNLLLLVGLLGLGLLVYRELDRDPEPAPIIGVDRDTIHSIRLEAAGRPALHLERHGDGWRNAAPPHWPADTLQVTRLLRLMRERPQRSYTSDALDLTKLGLAPARARIWLNDIEIAFGATAPLDELRYIQIDSQVYLIQDLYQHLVAGNAQQWISRRLLPEGADIQGLELPSFSARRGPEGDWQLEPEQPSISTDALHQLSTSWRNATAVRVKPAPPTPAQQPIKVSLADQVIHFSPRREGADWVLYRPDLQLDYYLNEPMAAALMLGNDTPASDEASP